MRQIAQTARAWVEGRVARKEIVASTGAGYLKPILSFADFVGPRDVGSITHRDVDDWRTKITPGMAAGTVRAWISPLRLFFVWCVREGYVRRDPTAGIILPKKPRSVPRGLPDEWAGKVLAAARDEREAVMISLELMEGARSIEVSRLELADIDRRTMLIRLVGKGGHVREVPLTRQTLRRIDRYVAAERGSAAGRLIQSRLKSTWNDEDGLKSVSIYHLVAKAFRRAGVPETGHALRHTAAYGLIEAGASVRHVQEFLGHAHLNTTGIYMKRAKADEYRPFVGTKDYDAAA